MTTFIFIIVILFGNSDNTIFEKQYHHIIKIKMLCMRIKLSSLKIEMLSFLICLVYGI